MSKPTSALFKQHCVAELIFVALLSAVAGSCANSERETVAKAKSAQLPEEQAATAALARTCRPARQGEAGDHEIAVCLAHDAASAGQPERQDRTPGPVVLFVDRSASMRGFLDPAYVTTERTDYRSVIDRLVVGLRPASGFSFGSALRPIDPTLSTLGSKEFYSDRDTRVEAVLDVIEKDTSLANSFVIIGDGRRGSPDVANGQFVRMRSVGDRWIERGGSIAVAASHAPFQTVSGDPSGCRESSGSGATDRQTCPLYAFVFARPGSANAVLSVLAPVFQHVFTWPLARLTPDEVTLDPVENNRSDIRFERQWDRARDGSPIARVRGPAPATRWLTARVALSDTTAPLRRAQLAAVKGQRLAVLLAVRALAPGAAAVPWSPIEASSSTLVRPTPAAVLSIDAVTRGPSGPRTIYRVDFVATGIPSWVDAFDAGSANDRVRTYGLGRLFESFRDRATRLTADDRAVRVFVVAN